MNWELWWNVLLLGSIDKRQVGLYSRKIIVLWVARFSESDLPCHILLVKKS